MLQCWSEEPSNRPDFSDICKELQLLVDPDLDYVSMAKQDPDYINISQMVDPQPDDSLEEDTKVFIDEIKEEEILDNDVD